MTIPGDKGMVYPELDRCVGVYDVVKWIATSGVPTRKEVEQMLQEFGDGSDDGIDEMAETISKKYSKKLRKMYDKMG